MADWNVTGDSPDDHRIAAALVAEHYANAAVSLLWLTESPESGRWRLEHANPNAMRLLGVATIADLRGLPLPTIRHSPRSFSTEALTAGELLSAAALVAADGGVLGDELHAALRPRFTARRFTAAGVSGVELVGRHVDLSVDTRRTYQTAQRLMATYFQHAGVEAFMKDLDGRYVIVNESFADTYDHDGTGLVGCTDFEIVDADTANRYRAEDRRVMQTLSTTTVQSATERPDGTHLFRVVKFPVFDDDGTTLIGVGGVATDVTEPTNSRAALAISEEQFRMAFVHASEGIAIVSLDNVLLQANDRMCELLGRPREELIGHVGTEFYHPESVLSFPSVAAEARSVGHAVVDAHLVRPDGSPVWMRASIGVVHDESGAPLHLVAMCTDETERRELDARARQTEKLEAIGRLSGGIAHDINNLLSGILGHAELVKAAQTDPRLADQCEQVIAAAVRAADYTSRLVTFARPESPSSACFDVHDLIDEVVQMLRHQLHPDTHVVAELGATAPLVRGNPTQIHGLLLNLALNARDALQGSGTITFRTADETEGDAAGSIRIEVADDGVGIEPEALIRIFDAFYTTKAEGRGTGLGLTSVLAAVHHHEGTIDVVSTPGEGTTVIVHLPRAPESDSPTEAPDGVRLRPGTTVLVVDDDPVVRFVVAQSLRAAGCEVSEAGDGAEAIEQLERAHAAAAPPRAVVFDMRMPGMGGADLYAVLAERWPAVATVLMSGFGGDAGAESLRRQGVGAVLQKPFRSAELVATVARAVGA